MLNARDWVNLHDDLREFIGLLISHKVDFVLVGGHAVAIHGYPRFTGDMDFFYRADQENAERVRAVLDAFGFADLDVTPAELVQPERVVQLGAPPNRIDLLSSISGVSFDDVWESRQRISIGDYQVSVISRALLLTNKRASGRTKDLLDIEMLEAEEPSGD